MNTIIIIWRLLQLIMTYKRTINICHMPNAIAVKNAKILKAFKNIEDTVPLMQILI
jgi:alpha-galactosidase/6-phospho-beta-glucosidase family protein